MCLARASARMHWLTTLGARDAQTRCNGLRHWTSLCGWRVVRLVAFGVQRLWHCLASPWLSCALGSGSWLSVAGCLFVYVFCTCGLLYPSRAAWTPFSSGARRGWSLALRLHWPANQLHGSEYEPILGSRLYPSPLAFPADTPSLASGHGRSALIPLSPPAREGGPNGHGV